MSGKQALTAREAANELGISVATLYAYVSRGLIHSEPGPVGSRQRRYRLADVQALKERQAQRRDPARSVETALHWGTPLLESSITLIENNCLYYRGHNVINLARTQRFEDVVGLLWTGKHDGAAIELGENHPRERVPIELPATLSPLERIHARLPILANADIAAYDLRPHAIMRVGRSILGALVEEIGGRPIAGSTADTLAERWAPGSTNAKRLIDAALIVSADHELNASSFTVRCVASVGAPLYNAIGAGIGALRGVRHGAATHQVEALLAEVGAPKRALSVLGDRLRRGERIPGFGHQLYPEGDPRGALLIEVCNELMPATPASILINAIIAAVAELIEERPNVDLGLVAVSHALGRERGSALSLMALGRTAGWVAHALEQYQQEQMIRPRAKYVGVQPLYSD